MQKRAGKTRSVNRHDGIVRIRACIGAGRLEEAFAIAQKLRGELRRDAEVEFLLGLIAEQTGEYSIARRHAERSVSIEAHPDSLYLLSRIERFEGNTDEALSLCDRAMHGAVDSVALCIHRAGTLEAAGRVAEARAAVEPMIERLEAGGKVIPGELRFELAKVLVQEKQYAQAVELIEALVTEDSTPDELRRLQLYLQAKALDRSRRYQEAFEAATRANRIGELPFDPGMYEQQVSMLIEQWSADRMSRFPKSSCDDELPVFVAGMPRSGTSLIDQIIDAHPRAAGVGELGSIERFAQQLAQVYDPEKEPPACFGRLDRFRWSRVAREYVKGVRALAPDGAERVVNKALGNNKLVGLLACLFPRTRIIHAIRDPRDVAVSCYLGGFNDRVHPWTTRVEWIRCAWEQSERMMAHWDSVLDVPILRVEYERLVSSPREEAGRLIEFLGLEWDERCLRSHETQRTVRTLSYDQVNQPIYTSSVGRHARYRACVDGLE